MRTARTRFNLNSKFKLKQRERTFSTCVHCVQLERDASGGDVHSHGELRKKSIPNNNKEYVLYYFMLFFFLQAATATAS